MSEMMPTDEYGATVQFVSHDGMFLGAKPMWDYLDEVIQERDALRDEIERLKRGTVSVSEFMESVHVADGGGDDE